MSERPSNMHDRGESETEMAAMLRSAAVAVICSSDATVVAARLGLAESGLTRLLANRRWDLQTGFRVLDCLDLTPLVEVPGGVVRNGE